MGKEKTKKKSEVRRITVVLNSNEVFQSNQPKVSFIKKF